MIYCNNLIRFAFYGFLLIELPSIQSPLFGADAIAPKIIRVAIYADAGATKTDVPQVEHCLPSSKASK